MKSFGVPSKSDVGKSSGARLCDINNVIIIIIIITMTMFIMLSSWHSHCKCLLGSRDQYSTTPGGHRPFDQANQLEPQARRKTAGKLHPPLPFIIITQPES